jgi:16S rRNA (cytidine1402-2'-O)-methyltransferase
MAAGTLYVVSTPIGNLEDVTLRALRVLREAALIAAEDTRHTARLLDRYEIRTPTTSFHEHNERRKIGSLIERLRAGSSIAVVSDAGTPGVRDPGYRLVRQAISEGIRVEAIPGPSALLTALVASGLPTDTFTFLGFPPARGSARTAWLEQLGAETRTVVFFEAPHRIRETLAALARVAGDREVVIGRELTKIHEELIRGTAAALLEGLSEPRGEMTVVVAPPGAPSPVEPASDEAIWEAYQQAAAAADVSRRRAVLATARRFRMPPNAVYAAIERRKAAIEGR